MEADSFAARFAADFPPGDVLSFSSWDQRDSFYLGNEGTADRRGLGDLPANRAFMRTATAMFIGLILQTEAISTLQSAGCCLWSQIGAKRRIVCSLVSEWTLQRRTGISTL
jgi:hypothetical protein